MAQNDFLVFNENDNNTLTQEEYSTDSQRIGGLQGGIARSKIHNKLLRQLSIATYSLAKIITDSGQDALDTDPEAFYTNLKTVLQQVQGATEGIAGILELASNADVDAINPANENTANDTKAVTLRKIVRGIKNKKLIQQASQITEGVTRYANFTEAQSQTSNNLAISPLILKQLKEAGMLGGIKQIYNQAKLIPNPKNTEDTIINFPNWFTVNPAKTVVLLNGTYGVIKYPTVSIPVPPILVSIESTRIIVRRSASFPISVDDEFGVVGYQVIEYY